MPSPTRLLAVLALVGVACGGTTTSGPSTPPVTSTATEEPSSARATAPVEVFTTPPALHPSVDDWSAGTVEVVTDDRVHRVAVLIADTPDERAHGLMEVPELPDGAGMWFVYDEDRDGGFWMKNTLVPLDITYVGPDGRIVFVAEAVPCEADPCPTYPPDEPYRHVLEVPAGYLDRIGAEVGDVVRLVAG